MSKTALRSLPAGSRRFWMTVLCFAVANAGAWLTFAHLTHGRRGLLEVLHVSPGDAGVVHGRPTVSWAFNLDVLPTPVAFPPGEITPNIHGQWRWDNPRTLTFTPEAPLAKASNFRFILHPERLRTPDGLGLAKPFVSTFATERLEVVSVRQAEFDERDRLVLEIEFNDEVIPAEVLGHLTVTPADGKPINATVHGEASGHTARFLTDVLPDTSVNGNKSYVQVKLSPGLVGRAGPLGLLETYASNLNIGSDLIATGASSYFADHSTAALTVQFNNRVDLGVLKPLVSVSPPVQFTLARRYDGVSLLGAFQPATRYSIQIAKAPVGVSPSLCPRPDTLSVFVPDVSPSFWFEHEEGYLGSSGNRALLAHAVNMTSLRAKVFRVYDNNLVAWRNTPQRGSRWAEGFSRPVASKVLPLSRKKNATQDLRISLDEMLPADAPRDGVYLVSLEPPHAESGAEESDDNDDDRGREFSVVTLSDIGLSAKRTRAGVTIWATSLRTAEPQAGVRIRVYSNKNQFLGEASAGTDGLATLTLSSAIEGESPRVILADRPTADVRLAAKSSGASAARDLTWLDLSSSRLSSGDADTGGAAYLRTGFEAFIYTDRGVFRPGETVHLRAIIRGPEGSMPSSFPVSWQFRRPDLHDWRTVAGRIDSDGAVSLDLPLPDDLPTGRWSVALQLPGTLSDHKVFGSTTFQVEDFVPARMQVGLALEGKHNGDSPRLMMDGGGVVAKVQADYLFGKAVTGRPAQLVARIDPANFAPAKWDGWTFGDAAQTAATLDQQKITGHRRELPEQNLDENGSAQFSMNLEDLLQGLAEETEGQSVSAVSVKAVRRKRVRPVKASPANVNRLDYSGPWRLTVTASVVETGGRAVSTSTQAEVDVVPAYVGVRSRGTRIGVGSNAVFDVSMVTPDGRSAEFSSELEATLYREDWNNSLTYEKGRYVYHSARLLQKTGDPLRVSISGGKGEIEFPPLSAGSYVLRLEDPKTGAMTSLRFFPGDGAWDDNVSRENPERLELLVQKPAGGVELMHALRVFDFHTAAMAIRQAAMPQSGRFRPGETATVIVRSPFAGRLLLTVETDDVVSQRIIEMPASHAAIPIEISDAFRPNAFVSATIVRAVDPDAPWQTHRAFGTLRLPVDNDDRRLKVAVDAPTEIRPTTSLPVAVHVTDSSGRAVANAAITIAAVDEGICILSGFKTPDPFAFFNRDRALSVETSDLFGQLMPEVPAAGKTSSIGGDKDGYDPRHSSPVSAKRVKPVSLVSAVLHTDNEGIAHCDFNIPQFAGKLRLMAVATSSNTYGSAAGAALVRSPLLVQSSWPRFAAPGDRFLVPLVLFNNGPVGGEASVSLHVNHGPLRFLTSRDAQLSAMAIKPNGQSTRYVEVNVSRETGVAQITLTVHLNGETYSEEVELPVRPASPEITVGGYAVAQPGKVTEISLPGGNLSGTDRTQIKVTPFPTLELPQGLEYLEHYPYGCLEQTTSTLFPLVYLGDIGQSIAPGMFDKQRLEMKVNAGITRLIGMQTADGGLAMWPAYREPWAWGSVYAAHFLVEAEKAGFSVPAEFRKQLFGYLRNTLNQSSDNPEMLQTQAYACYVLALAGTPERTVMSRLAEVIRVGDGSSGEARFHLAAAFLASGRRDLAEGLIPQALPGFGNSRSLSGSLSSPIRQRAVLANTLLDIQPDHPALPAMVQQLADAGSRHEWRSTQDTAFAVLALGRYLRQARTAKPYESAELQQGGKTVAGALQGSALNWNASGDQPRKVSVQLTGAADSKAYISWLETGVPLIPPKPADNGLQIRRRLLDESGMPLKPGAPVRSGDLIQIELSISSDTELENLVVEDLLPAGLEIENPRLATSAKDVAAPSKAEANCFQDHRIDMRDDRLVVMGSLARPGTGTYVYSARAVTAGTFVLPPARGECMYDMGINSISDSGQLQVVALDSPRMANLEPGDQGP